MRTVNPCPNVEVLECGGPEVDAHVAECLACRSILVLMSADVAAESPVDCARAELLIAAGGASPLGTEDAAFLPAHLACCPSCREIALEPPFAEIGELPAVSPENYLLGAEIGRGGMGRVLSARDRRIGRAVALKEMLATDAPARMRFEREARITAQLQHPSIVSIYEVGRWPDGRPFYAMPVLTGRTLRDAIAAAPELEDRLALIPRLIAAADAVAYAHSQRVIHRDLTPSNILLGSFGETIVIDWGLAKDLDEDEPQEGGRDGTRPGGSPGLTRAGAVVGTVAYMSLEQAQGTQVDERTDVYALGAILCQLLTGRPPHRGERATSVVAELRDRDPTRLRLPPRVPRDLASIMRRALEPDAAARYATAAEFVEDLRRFQNRQRVLAHTYSRRDVASRWLGRHVAKVFSLAVAMAVLAGIVSVAADRVRREQRRGDEMSTALLAEQGRLELLQGDAHRSLAYLGEAYRRGDRSIPLRFLLGAASRSVAALGGYSIPAVYAADVSWIANGRKVALAVGHQIQVWDLAAPTAPVVLDGWGGGGTFPLTRARSLNRRRLTLSHDGSRLLSWILPSFGAVADETSAVVWKSDLSASTAKPVARFGHWVWDAALSGDGGLALTVRQSPPGAQLWDTDTGQPISMAPGPLGYGLLGARLSRDGRRVLTLRYGGDVIHVRDSRSGAQLGSFRPGVGALQAADISPNGELVVAAGESGAMLWDTAAKRPIATFGVGASAKRVQFSPDGSRLLVANSLDEIALHSARGAHLAHLGTAADALFNPEGSRIATADVNRSVKIWSGSGALLDTHGLRRRSVTQMSFSPDGSRLAMIDGTHLHIWHFTRGAVVASGGPAARSVVGFSPDGQRLLTRGQEWDLLSLDVNAGRRSEAWSAVPKHRAVSFTRDRSKVLVILEDDPTRPQVRSTSTGAEQLRLAANESVVSAGISGDGSRILTVSVLGTTTLWDGRTGRAVATLDEYRGREVSAFAFNHDGTRLFIHDSRDRQSQLWDRDGRPLATLVAGSPAHPMFSPDGNLLVTMNDQLRVWAASDGRLLYRSRDVGADASPVNAAFSSDSAYLAAVMIAGKATRVLVLDAARGTPLATVNAERALDVAFSPDNVLLAVAGSHGTTLWDWQTQRVLARLGVTAREREAGADPIGAGLSAPKRLLEFSADGALLAVCEPAGGVLVWNTHLEDRSTDAIDKVRQQFVPWRMESGRLVLDGRTAATPATGAQNLTFASGTLGGSPPGWMEPTREYGYNAAVVSDCGWRGPRCALLEGKPRGHSFGNLMQVIEATPFRNQTVRLRAFVRSAGPGPAQLWLRVDRAGQTRGFFDNMGNRPITSREWKAYEIVGEVASDAERLNFGMMVIGEGKAWLSDVTLEVVPKTQ